MFVFGGWNGNEFYNDVFILDLEIMAWSRPNCTGKRFLIISFLGPAPCPRKGHCSILIGTNLVVHGGFTFNEEHMKKNVNRIGSALQECYLNDIRVLDTETFIWSRLRVSGSPPEHRADHTLDISGSDIILFGGWTKTSGAR
jgi:host cell factor